MSAKPPGFHDPYLEERRERFRAFHIRVPNPSPPECWCWAYPRPDVSLKPTEPHRPHCCLQAWIAAGRPKVVRAGAASGELFYEARERGYDPDEPATYQAWSQAYEHFGGPPSRTLQVQPIGLGHAFRILLVVKEEPADGSTPSRTEPADGFCPSEQTSLK